MKTPRNSCRRVGPWRVAWQSNWRPKRPRSCRRWSAAMSPGTSQPQVRQSQSVWLSILQIEQPLLVLPLLYVIRNVWTYDRWAYAAPPSWCYQSSSSGTQHDRSFQPFSSEFPHLFCFRKSAFRLSKLLSLHALPITIEPKSVLV